MTPSPAPREPHGDAAEDAATVAALLAGDEAAFARLVRRHHAALVRLALAYVRTPDVAEEVAQETWLAVLDGLRRFEGRSSLRTWIFRILVNRAKTRGVRERRSLPFSALEAEDASGEPTVDVDRFLGPDHPHWPGHWAAAPASWGGDVERRLLDGELRDRIAAAIDALPAGQRAVITLRDVAGCDAEETCEALAISPGNQRVLLHRARARVRGALEDYLEAEPRRTAVTSR